MMSRAAFVVLYLVLLVPGTTLAQGTWSSAMSRADTEFSGSGSEPRLNFVNVAYGNGTYVAVANGRTLSSEQKLPVYSSADGQSWTRSATLARVFDERDGSGKVNVSVNDLKFVNGMFVAVGGKFRTDGVVWVSSDGTDWTGYRADLDSGTHNGNYLRELEGIAYGNGVYMVVAGGGDFAATTTDFQSWTAVDLPVSAQWEDIAFGNDAFVAVGWTVAFQGAAPDQHLIATADGSTWSEVSVEAIDGSDVTPGQSVVFDNSTFVALGEDDKVAISSDGFNWSDSRPHGVMRTDTYRDAVYVDGNWVLAAEHGESHGAVAVTSDFLSWSRRRLAESTSSTDGNLTGVAVGFNGVVAVGRTDADIYYSPKASASDLPNFSNLQSFSALAGSSFEVQVQVSGFSASRYGARDTSEGGSNGASQSLGATEATSTFSIDSSTGVLSGDPADPGVVSVLLWAHDDEDVMIQAPHFVVVTDGGDDSGGGTAVQLTMDDGQSKTPSWSTDGKRVVYKSNDNSGHENTYYVHDMAPDGTDNRQIIVFASGANDWGARTGGPVTFAAAGQALFYDASSLHEIILADVSGSTQLPLDKYQDGDQSGLTTLLTVPAGFAASSPVFAESAGTLFWTVRTSPNNDQQRTYQIRAADISTLSGGSSHDQGATVFETGDDALIGDGLDVTSDGSTVVFGGVPSDYSGQPFMDIYAVDTASGQVDRLTTDGDAAGDSFNPDISPDGQWIVYAWKSGINSEIRMIPFAGGAHITLTSAEGAFDSEPRFSPDGTDVAFTRSIDGNSDIWLLSDISVSTATEGDFLPTTYRLEENYPNPFNPITTIRYSIPRTTFVSVEVFDLQGRRVATLVSGLRSSGEHSVRFHGAGLASGLYVYRLTADEFSQSRKMMLLK